MGKGANNDHIPVATATPVDENRRDGVIHGTARPVQQNNQPPQAHVGVLPGRAFGIVVQTQYASSELRQLAARVLQIASTIMTLSIVLAIINVLFVIFLIRDGSVIVSAIIYAALSIMIATSLFRIAYMGVATRNAKHGCAPCCPCCPGFLQFYRNLAALGLAYHIIVAILEGLSGDWLGCAFSILLSIIFYQAVSRCQAFLKYIRKNPNDGGRPVNHTNASRV